MRGVRWSIGLALLSGLLGCGQLLVAKPVLTPVKAWEKGVLARPEMTFEFDRMDSAFVEHTYASKEAASGGSSAAGGGCGCN